MIVANNLRNTFKSVTASDGISFEANDGEVTVLIAPATRSFKESQTYLGLLPLVPVIPIFSQTPLMGQFVRGEAVELTGVLISMSTSMLISVIPFWFCAKLYERESLIFSS